MDNNNEDFFGFEEEVAAENEQSEKSEENDEILSELNSRSKKLETCITARQTCNKLKDRIRNCKERLKAQEKIVEDLKLRYASIIAIEVTNDDEYKNSVKQDCLAISEYARVISQEIDSNPSNISKSADEIEKRLPSIKLKGAIVAALQEKNNLFQAHADLQKHCIAAENRFQIAFADYNDNRLF
jgi:mannitol-1-phosphate/altronate dehydrogenase